MFVHKLLPMLQTKNGNRFECVENVILTERIQPGSNNRGQKHINKRHQYKLLNIKVENDIILYRW